MKKQRKVRKRLANEMDGYTYGSLTFFLISEKTLYIFLHELWGIILYVWRVCAGIFSLFVRVWRP